MENRKEIEKAKQRLKDRIEMNKKLLKEASTFGELTVDIIDDNKAINTLLEYIKELEQKNKKLNKTLKNKQENIYYSLKNFTDLFGTITIDINI